MQLFWGPSDPRIGGERGSPLCGGREGVDVLIAGAGPAGSVAATILARAGIRVMVVDRARFPREKLCGDTLNPGAMAILKRLDLAERVERRGLCLDGMILTAEHGVSVQGCYPLAPERRVGRAIRRGELDDVLLTRAIESGARFDEGVIVQEPLIQDGPGGPKVCGLLVSGPVGRSRRVPATVTIAADGRRSPIAFSLGLLRHPLSPRRWAVGGYFQSVDGMSSFGEMHVRCGHYIGVAPLPDGLANVCFVSDERQQFSDPKLMLKSTLEGDACLRERFANARLVSRLTVMGPLAVDSHAAGMPGLLLAGDAAGFIDPITGDGIRMAIRGGELAAQAALDMLYTNSSNGYKRLTQLRHQEFDRKLRFNRRVRALVGSAVGVHAGGICTAIAPGILRRMIWIAADL